MKIKDLESFRYSITGLANGLRPATPLATLTSLNVTMSATYDTLIAFHETRIRTESTSAHPEQILRNSRTALNAFLTSLGKTQGAPIGQELGDEFEERLATHLRTLSLSERTISDRKSLLKSWQTSFILLGTAPEVTVRGRERRSSKADVVHSPFEKGLRDALKIARLGVKTTAKLAEIHSSALQRWLRGALPNCRSNESINRLEIVLNLPHGHLTSLLDESLNRLTPSHPNEHRERLRNQVKDKYRISPSDISKELKQQWGKLVAHKMGTHLRGEKRHSRGRWTYSGPQEYCKNPLPGINVFNGMHVGSADVNWNYVCSYLGFIGLHKDLHGFEVDISVNAHQSIAWLAVPEAIDAYMNFMQARAGGICNNGHAVFGGFVASLNHPEHGYLTQNPELADSLPQEVFSGRSWSDMNSESLAVAIDWKAGATGISRDPSQPIQFLLDQDEPMEPIFKAMEQLRNLANNAAAGSVEEAVHRRNEFLIGVLAYNPLRRKNLISLTYRSDNSGNLYRSVNGEWRIRILTTAFKSGKTKASSSKRYDVALAPWLQDITTEYIQHFRPILASDSKTDTLFLSSRDARNLLDLSHLVLDITRQHIPGSGGFGPHAFRHLVATIWLTRNPNDFVTVSELLNDTLEVVMKTYAHLKKDHALNRHSAQFEKILPNYLR